MDRHEHSGAEETKGTNDADTGISAIIITRNRRDILQETIRCLLGSRREIDEIILIDNGSTDGTAEMIENQPADIHLIRLPTNLGIPQARNIGALNAAKEFLLFLDDDGTLDCTCLTYLAQFLHEDERLAVVACNVIDVKDGKTRANSWKLEAGSWKKRQSGKGTDGTNVPLSHELRPMSSFSEGGAPSLQSTYTFYGGAAMLKRRAFLEVGMFPEHFFYSHEEDDLSFRLIAKGYQLALCPQAIFTHYRLAREQPSSRKHRIFHYYRNRQYVIWRNLPWWAAIRESSATLIGGAIRTIFTPYFPAFLSGSAAAFAGLVRVIRNERSPLSREQYVQYRRLGQEVMQYRHRVGNLLLDVRKHRKLNWI